MRQDLPTITAHGLTWTIISRNERAITHEGRHFMAFRCKPGLPYCLFEHDRDITVNGSAKSLRTFVLRYDVKLLSHAVLGICAGNTDMHPSIEGSLSWVAAKLAYDMRGK